MVNKMGWDKNNKIEQRVEKPVEVKTVEVENKKQRIYDPEKKKVMTFYGRKGEGKTTALLSLIDKKDKVLLISFDGMSGIIQRNFFPELNVDIYDAYEKPRFVIDEKNDGTLLPIESVENAYYNCQELLKKLKDTKVGQYDIIVFDGLNIGEKLAESFMRFRKGLKFDEAFADFNNWKIRNAVVNSWFWQAVEKANKGVIYTLYPVEDIRKKEKGQTIDSEQIPKYAEDVMYLTSVVIKIERRMIRNQAGNEEKKHYAIVESSKIKDIEDGKIYDITNKNLSAYIKM